VTDTDDENEADLLDLLKKMTQDGGKRTGELRRRGWLTWNVTDTGRRVLRDAEEKKE